MINGATFKDNAYRCDKCGANLEEENSVQVTAHLDGVDFYQTEFKCVQCGQIIVMRNERKDPWEGV